MTENNYYGYSALFRKNKIIIAALSLVLFIFINIPLMLCLNIYSENIVAQCIAFFATYILTVIYLSVFSVTKRKTGKLLIFFFSFLPSAVSSLSAIAFESYEAFFATVLETAAVLAVSLVLTIVFLKFDKKYCGIKDSRFLLKFVRCAVIYICIFSFSLSVGTAVNNLNSDEALYEIDIKMTSAVKATNNAKSDDNSYVKYYSEELSALIDGSWENLHAQQKLDIAQTVVNIYSTAYGLNHSVQVGVSDLSAQEDGIITFAVFNKQLNYIFMDTRCFSSDYCEEDFLSTVLHEFYHAYQYEQVDALAYLPDSVKKLRIFDDAVNYKNGLENYTQGYEDFDTYYSQYVELTARNFSYDESKNLIYEIKENCS